MVEPANDDFQDTLKELQLRLAELEVAAEQERLDEIRTRRALAALPASIAVYNEQIKYTATFLNTVAAGAIVAGAIAPITAIFISGSSSVSISATLLSVIWFTIGCALHLAVRKLLRRMKA